MQTYSIGRTLTLATLFALSVVALSVLALSIAAQQLTTLVVSGRTGQAKVAQVEGHNYVEVEGLARITNASLSFNGDQIVLTFPTSGENPTAPISAPGFSKAFSRSAIEAMAEVREWHTALRTGIERGLPLSEDWLGSYRAQAQEALRLASVNISTDSDKNVYPFLVNMFNNMGALTDKYEAMTKSLTYIDPNSLQTDPLNQRIHACGHALASMASSNHFDDDGSCQ